jgi:hypothetical protein
MKSYLVEVVSNIASAAFKFLCELKLNDHEVKDYASKNMMLNLQSIFKHSIQSIEEVILKEKR